MMVMNPVRQFMTGDVATIESAGSALDAARLMTEKGKGCLVVVDRGGRPVGILTERDFVRRIIKEDLSPAGVRVSSVMSKPLVTIGPEVSIHEAAKTMVEHRIRRLAVVDGGKLVGIITATDFAKLLGWDAEKRKMDPDMIVQAMIRYYCLQ